jgi:hypothetical protein
MRIAAIAASLRLMNSSIAAARECDGALGSPCLFLDPRLDSLSHLGPIAWVYGER